MRTILIASKNEGKIREIERAFSTLPVTITSLYSHQELPDAEEIGQTYEENAIGKATYYGSNLGMLTIADDSGLEIDALGGKPGIYSARYVEGSDEEKIRKILTELNEVKDEERTACFISVVALYENDNQKSTTFKGVAEGFITREIRGSSGFGYDPIFFSPTIGKTFGEASPEEKALVSHREQALVKCKKYLNSILNGTL